MGKLEIKWKKIDVGDTKDIGILKMSDEDRVCDDCKKEISKISKEQKKQEFSEQLNELADRSIEYKTKWNKDGIL